MEATVNIERFLDGEGKIIKLPKRHETREAVLLYLADKFEPGRIYAEREINAVCEAWHTFEDYFLLRRELVDHGLLGRERDGSRYWLAKHETQPETPPVSTQPE